VTLRPDELDALRLSLEVALVATILSLAPGLLLAWCLARLRFPGKALVDVLIHLPLVLPPVVIGYILLRWLGRASPLGGWIHEQLGIDLAFTPTAAMIAAAIMGFPLLVRSARTAFELVDPRLEAAARTLGAGRVRVFVAVTLPLAWPGILAGMTLAWTRSLGEFGATITFAGNIEGETRTLASAIYTAAQRPGGDAAASRLLLVSIAVSLAALFLSEWLHRRALRQRGLGDAQQGADRA
jgi:molybdate transport system permease protein